jgi:branched-chain amino acid transport system substrate-binding protein
MTNLAITIGINEYNHLHSLLYAEQDAEGMDALLKGNLNFEKVYLFTQNAPSIPADPNPISTNPTYATIRGFLNRQFREEYPLLKAGDNLWFFFAGHGQQQNNIDYLMLLDSDPTDLKNTAISVDFLIQRLRTCGADNIVLFLDACRDSNYERGGIRTNSYPGVVIFYSCRPTETSSEIGAPINQGSFTYVLMQALRGESTPPCITVSHFDEYLREQVPTLNSDYRKRIQNPSTAINPESKRFLILLPRLATEVGITNLKNQAFEAEVRGSRDLALKLFERVLEVTGEQDIQVNESILRLKAAPDLIKKSSPKQTTIYKPIEVKKTYKNSLERKIKSLVLPSGIIGVFLLGYFLRDCTVPINPPVTSCVTNAQPIRGMQTSLGTKTLLKKDTNIYKEKGVALYARGDYSKAIENLESYRSGKKNGTKCISDPEALIYLNNAKVIHSPHLKIAVSVPIGTNSNVAKEILRGVAQAQNEINLNSVIRGKFLQIEIANDDNNEDIGEQVARSFVNDSNVLAVVGHNASSVSIKAAMTYSREGLVAISPTSYAQTNTGNGSFAYRLNPSIDVVATSLAKYILKTGKKNILVCRDPQKADIYKTFIKTFRNTVGSSRINPTICDLSKKDLDSKRVISEATKSGADSIVFHPFIDDIYKVIRIAKELESITSQKLELFSVPTLYTDETLQTGKNAINSMILVVPWHPEFDQKNPFPEKAKKLWPGSVNWRTAMSYDAVMVIAQALQNNESRDGIKQYLDSTKFFYKGATGKVDFLDTGDRKPINLAFVKIQPDSNSNSGYKFSLIPKEQP